MIPQGIDQLRGDLGVSDPRVSAEIVKSVEIGLDIEIVQALENLDLQSVTVNYEPEEVLGREARFLRLRGDLVTIEPDSAGEPKRTKVGEIKAYQGVDWSKSDQSKGTEGLKYYIGVELALPIRDRSTSLDYFPRYDLREREAIKFVEALNGVGIELELKKV